MVMTQTMDLEDESETDDAPVHSGPPMPLPPDEHIVATLDRWEAEHKAIKEFEAKRRASPGL